MLGAMVGSYRITRLLGEGGMGSVYEAINDSIERRVAIKVLNAENAKHPDTVTRFFNESGSVISRRAFRRKSAQGKRRERQ